MDLVTGRRINLPKTLLIELLASIPYRAWELRMYSKLTLGYRNRQANQSMAYRPIFYLVYDMFIPIFTLKTGVLYH